MLQELGEVRDDDVGAVLEQGLPLSGAVDSDNEAEVPGAPRLDSRQCVLEDGRFGRLDADLLRRREERVGRRLSLQVPLLDGDPVDADLEQVLDPGGLEDVLAVRAGGHDGSVEPRLANRMDVPHRPVVGLDAVAFQKCHHELVLAVSETVENKGPIRNGDPTEASLAMPTWRSWRLCRRARLNPAGSAKAGPIRNGDPTEASLAMPTWRSWRLCRRDRLDPAGVAKGGPIRN